MRTVWTNGCFDVLHRGHIELFKYASSLGDRLLVGLDTDEKVKADKGSDRPFNNLEDRKFVLESITYIDEVLEFDSRNALESLIKNLKPDILVVGSDWKGKEVVGGEYAGKVNFFDRISGYSTTNILEKK
tara:strand:- start:1611 stop:2000 length:390 start_codon:yes stop_codon:yes gene_type:complete